MDWIVYLQGYSDHIKKGELEDCIEYIAGRKGTIVTFERSVRVIVFRD